MQPKDLLVFAVKVENPAKAALEEVARVVLPAPPATPSPLAQKVMRQQLQAAHFPGYTFFPTQPQVNNPFGGGTSSLNSSMPGGWGSTYTDGGTYTYQS